jgi:hypothetical protein
MADIKNAYLTAPITEKVVKLVLDFDTQSIAWEGIDQPMKTQGELQK